MRKQSLMILALTLFLVSSTFITTSEAWISLWGVQAGKSRAFQFTRELCELNGSPIETMDSFRLQYIVLNESDPLGFGYSDLTLLFIDLSTEPLTITETILLSWSWIGVAAQGQALVFNSLHDSALLTALRGGPAGSSSLVLPIKRSGICGLDWVVALNRVNTSITGYIAYNFTTYARITYNVTNQLDSNLNARYRETGTIIWNMTTGWLESLEYNRTYESPIDFSVITKITPYSQTITNGGLVISVRDIFAWIGLGVAAAGLAFALFVLKKMKRTPDPEVE